MKLEKGKTRRDTRVQEAEEFLARVLSRGMLPLGTIREFAKHESISDASLKRAKENMKVVSVMTDSYPAIVKGWRLSDEKGNA